MDDRTDTTPGTRAPFRRRRAVHLRLGRRGERLACRLVRRLGLDVLTRNYRTDHGEIDIVARDGATLCFIEVKTRHRADHGRPADAVGDAKRRRIIRAANRYRREIGNPPIRCRYDIVEIILQRASVIEARYWAAAFTDEPQPRSDVMARYD